jgi:GntR family transcriptional regulator
MPDVLSRSLLTHVPQYQRLAAELRARIESGELRPGQALPSEARMIEIYGVGRPTVRRAIAALSASGLVVTERGRPTRVLANVGLSTNGALRFDPAIRAEAGGWRTWDGEGWCDVGEPTRYRGDAGRHADALCLPRTDDVFVHERHLRHVSDVPATYRVHVPLVTVADVPALAENPFRPVADLYAVLTRAGHTLTWRDTVTAVMPAPEDAQALHLPGGVPVLVHTRTTHGNADDALILEETRLPADRTVLTTRA